jgi:hypothetical protein
VREGWIREERLHTRWSPWPDCNIETTQFFLGDWEIRAHRILASQTFECLESGYAVAQLADARAPLVEGDAAMGADGAESRLVDFHGLRVPGSRAVMPNTSNMFRAAIVPVLGGTIAAGETLLVTAVHLRPPAARPCPALSRPDLSTALADAGLVPAAGGQSTGSDPSLLVNT